MRFFFSWRSWSICFQIIGPEIMRHKTNATSNDPLLDMVERGDLELLMRAVPASLLGHIMQLNRLPRYHNRLDAILLAVRIEELRSLENGRAANFR